MGFELPLLSGFSFCREPTTTTLHITRSVLLQHFRISETHALVTVTVAIRKLNEDSGSKFHGQVDIKTLIIAYLKCFI